MNDPAFTEGNPNASVQMPVIFLKKYANSFAILLFASGIICRNTAWMTNLLHLILQVSGVQLNPEFRLIGFNMMGSCFLLIGFILLLFKLAGGEHTIFTKKQLFITAPIAILVFYWITLFESMANVPITDDYFTVLNFLNSFIHINELHEQWAIIYAPYVETRNVITKLIVIGSYKISGQVNFNWFILLINIILSGTGYLVYRTANKVKTSHDLIIPLFLLIFQFSYYDAQLWTTAGIHIVLTMFFAIAAFFLLEKNTTPFFIAALMMALFASYTYGNGLLVFPVGLVILLIRKQKIKLLWWTLFFLLILFLYFQNYTPVKTAADFLSFKPQDLVLYCFAFYGSALQFMYRLELPVIFGASFSMIFLWLTKKKYYILNPINYSLMLYMILSGAMASLFRLDYQQGIQQALSNRYVIYSCMIFCCTIIALADIFEGAVYKKIKIWAYLFSISYFILSAFFFYPEVVIRKNKLNVFMEKVKNNLTVEYLPPLIPKEADTLIKTAKENGIYKP